jgi:integrase
MKLAMEAAGIPQDPPEPPPPKPYFSDFAEQWLSTHAKVECKHSTYRLYKQIVKQHLTDEFGVKRLDEIGRDDVKKFIASKIDQKLSKATVRNIMAPFREILTSAVEANHITNNPASRIGRFTKETSAKAGSTKIVPYTPSEVRMMMDKAKQREFTLYVFLMTLVLTGMRLGELIGLQWTDIDFNAKSISIKRAVSRRRLETPKSHLQRKIDLSNDLAKELRALRRQNKQRWFRKAEPFPAWVFPNEDGTFINEYNFRVRKFYPLFAKEEGNKERSLRRIRLHDLRHTFASIHLQNGESMVYVKEQMGHYSIQITVDLYGHLVPGTNQAAADRLAASFRPPKAVTAKA